MHERSSRYYDRMFLGAFEWKKSYAINEGTVTLDDKITLKNVLYVPDLMCNLILVYQLLDDYDGVAQFTNKFYVMEDRTSRMLIGAGEQREGLTSIAEDNDGNEVRHSVNHEEEQSVDQVFNYETNDSINDEEAQNADPVNSVLREGLPLEQNNQLPLANDKPLVDPEPYRILVGRLIYLSVTRPDLSYCVHMLAQVMQSPLQEHWDAALRVVRYLKGSPDQGILLRVACDLQLHGWCDLD
ncbi:retrovirus-related pol polyprotein from transposon TNT 1-94 [Tanacetum coccineum]